MKINIRKALDEDIDIFVAFAAKLSMFNRSNHSIECKYDHYELVLEAIKQKAEITFNNRNEDTLILIAEIDDLPVGYALGKIFEEEYTADNGTGKIGLIDEVFVDYGARGLGIGKTLIREVACWVQERGTNRIKLHVYSWNVNAKRLYEKCGFKEYAVSFEKFI